MMREILFRGKRIDNGEWVEGWLVLKKDCLLEITYCFILSQGKGESFVTWYSVDPDTVGQYTGLKDKNGKQIFEGDIWTCVGYNGLICWSQEDCAFVMRYTVANDEYECCINELKMRALEIIGNIHDNPELLEEKGWLFKRRWDDG